MNLLDEIPSKDKTLIVEFRAPQTPEEYPWLVTSTRGWVWVWKPLKNKTIRSALRYRKTPVELYLEGIEVARDMGLKAGWGNVVSSVDEAIAHVASYTGEPLETLTEGPFPKGISALVVPKERHLLGVALVSQSGVAIAMSNPSRFLGIVLERN